MGIFKVDSKQVSTQSVPLPVVLEGVKDSTGLGVRGGLRDGAAVLGALANRGKLIAIPFSLSSSSSASLGYSIPANFVVIDAYVEITTATSGASTLNFGTQSSGSGYISAASGATATVVVPASQASLIRSFVGTSPLAVYGALATGTGPCAGSLLLLCVDTSNTFVL